MRAPGLSFALLLTIALGVGSNASILGLLQGLTHPASPFTDSKGILSIVRQDRSRGVGPVSADDYQRLQNVDGAFEWVGAARIKLTDATIDGRSQTTTVATLTPRLAGALALPVEKGVVISHRLWERDFDDKDRAVGSHIRIEDRDFEITGVAGEHLDGLYSDQSVDLWIQASEQDMQRGDREVQDLWVLARLREGVSVRNAQADLRSGLLSGRELSVVPFTGIAPDRVRGLARVGMFLNFSAGVVFFIACINVASILLGRALRRSHETSLRVALGATRGELLRELFADSVVISIAGGAIGLFLGIMTAHALPALLFPEDAEHLSFTAHLAPILIASFVCIVITVLCGMMPVLGTVTDRPWRVLQRETSSPSKAIQRLRSGLVLGQITACCMLVTGTALLLSGLHSALRSSEGQALGNPILLTVQAQVGPDGPEVDPRYFTAVEKAATSIAGLRPLAWTAHLPGSQPAWQSFRMQRVSQAYRDVAMDIAGLSPDLSQPINNEPLAGRMFGLNDQGRLVAVVNEEAAAAMFGLHTAGMVIRDAGDRPIEIIGIVRRNSHDANQRTRPTIYYGLAGQSAVPRPIRDAKFRVPIVAPVAGIELSANVVSATYFDALGAGLIAGQTFPKLQSLGQPRVGVINQEAADLYFNGNPLGAAVIDETGARTEIIGVVRSPVFGTFDQHPEPAIYYPMGQGCPARMTLFLRASKWNKEISAVLLGKIADVPRGAAVPVAMTLDTQLAQSGLAGLRIATMIGGASAAAALILSILGLFSAQSDAEQQRQRDRALCIALGAQRWRVVLLVMKNAGQLALAGAVLGTGLCFALVRLIIADISVLPLPPLQVWLLAPLVPAAAVMVASMIPARRASVISPLAIMRDN